MRGYCGNMLRAVIFDIDDTLQDWQASIDRALQEVLEDVAPELRAVVPERLHRAIAARYFVIRDGCVVNREHWRLLFESGTVWEAVSLDVEPAIVQDVARRFQAALGAAVYPDARPLWKRCEVCAR